jgi:hypothetical protein
MAITTVGDNIMVHQENEDDIDDTTRDIVVPGTSGTGNGTAICTAMGAGGGVTGTIKQFQSLGQTKQDSGFFRKQKLGHHLGHGFYRQLEDLAKMNQ